MSTDIHNEGRGTWQRSWPQEFKCRRELAREGENKTYLEFLRSANKYENDRAYEGEEEEEGESEEEDDEDDDGENMSQEGYEAEEDVEKDECKVEGGYSKIRQFMKGGIGDDQMLQYPNQIEQVAGFCDRNAVESEERVALLDDRSNGSYDGGDGGSLSEMQGDRRPYLGPLTAQELAVELSRKVTHQQFRNDDQN